MAVFAVVLSTVAVSCWHWKTNYPNKSYPQAMEATFQSLDWKATASRVRDKLEYTFTDRLEREEAEKLAHEQHISRERALQREREKKAKEEAERKAAEKRQRDKEEAERKRREEARRLEIDAQKRAEEAARQQELERKAAAKREEEEREALIRPWGCNIPLAYIVHRRCRRLARLNPMYEESDLMNSFMQ